MVRKIILEKSKVISPKTITKKFQIKKLFETYNVDPTQFWYNTKYAKSFFTEDVLNDLLDKSYDDYSKNKGEYPLDLEEFRVVVLESYDIETIIVLMHYSPNLVKYILDLPNNYKNKTSNLKEKENRIFFSVVNDILQNRHTYHGSFSFIGEPVISKRVENNKFKELIMEFRSSLGMPGQIPSIFESNKGGRTI